MLLLQAIYISIAYGLCQCASTGARQSACEDMLPVHYGGPRLDPSPYKITLSDNKYSCGTNVTVFLWTNEIDGFKGFLCQSRGRDIAQYVTHGELSSRQPSGMGNNCNTNASLTQASADVKYSVSFIWTAPHKDVGPVTVVCTVVKDFSAFWVNITSTVLSFSGQCNGSGNNATSSTDSYISNTSSTRVSTTTNPVHTTKPTDCECNIKLTTRDTNSVTVPSTNPTNCECDASSAVTILFSWNIIGYAIMISMFTSLVST